MLDEDSHPGVPDAGASSGPGQRKRILFALITISSVLLMLGALAEAALRLYHGQFFSVESHLSEPLGRTNTPRAVYHPELGWLPSKGRIERTASESWFVGPDRFRSNGPKSIAPTVSNSTARPILAIGDSFTFGDEVLDHQTWPAKLEVASGRRVLNAGVSAFGVDQMYLYARSLVAEHRPEIVLLAMIGNDINRTELMYYSAWKPYYSLDVEHRREASQGLVPGCDSGVGLQLNQVPVPRDPRPPAPLAELREALGYSFLANAIAVRAFRGWWYWESTIPIHDDGEAITVELLCRLAKVASPT